MLVGCVAGDASLWAAALPFDLVATWWERRYGLVLDGYGAWAGGAWGTLGVRDRRSRRSLIVLLMALAAALPRTWWLAAARRS